jgi:drug/metabolite transporter (DMT)-like permease
VNITNLRAHTADAAMTGMVFVWGFHFMVLKNGLDALSPFTFNALRFGVVLPVFVLVALRNRTILDITRRDFRQIALVTLIGPIGFQILFVTGVSRTTSTNSALLSATGPAWTALFSMLAGFALIRRQLVIGIAVTLVGAALVVLGHGGSDLSLSHDDLTGSVLLLAANLVAAVSTVLNKPVADRMGGIRLAVWKFWLTAIGMFILAAPELVVLTPDDVPPSVWPNVIYSGLLGAGGGFLIGHYALEKLGPARMSSYQNFPPVIAALVGVLLLDDPLTAGLVIGGALTLWGVIVVRRNIFLRPAEPAPAPLAEPRPAVRRT